MRSRIEQTTLCFQGDLFHANANLLAEAVVMEKRFQKQIWISRLQQYWHYYFVRPYEALLRFMLEKHCA